MCQWHETHGQLTVPQYEIFTRYLSLKHYIPAVAVIGYLRCLRDCGFQDLQETHAETNITTKYHTLTLDNTETGMGAPPELLTG